MPIPVNIAVLLGMIWALILLGVYWATSEVLNKCAKWITLRRTLVVIAGVAFGARLLPNLFLPVGAGYDIESYQIVGNLVLRGEDVYTAQEAVRRHPYLPFQMYWMALALWLSQTLHLPFVKVVRLNPILFDVGIAVSLAMLFRRRSLSEAFRCGLLYALNPVPILVSAYHGQFDAVPAFFLLLAIGLVQISPLAAGVCLGMGILSKSWPILGLPSLLVALPEWRQRFWLLFASFLIPAVGVGIYGILFNASIWAVMERAISYNWGVGVWGYTYFFHLLSVLKPGCGAPFVWLVHNGRYLTLAALGLVWLLRARKQPLAASVLTVLVAFLAVTHAFSIQYLVWIIPFAILVQDHKWLYRYTLGAFAYMLLAYTTLILDMRITQLLPWPQADWFIIMPAGLPAWLITAGWASRRLFFGERARGASYA